MYILDDDKLNTIADYFIICPMLRLKNGDLPLKRWLIILHFDPVKPQKNLNNYYSHDDSWVLKLKKEIKYYKKHIIHLHIIIILNLSFLDLDSILQAHLSENNDNKAINLGSRKKLLHDLFKIMYFNIFLENIENADLDEYKVTI
ncbi:LOW QUALITY PROTEIN: hypothetical protein HZS_406 [Henneguya salminicola]|nr:LOW QUALITY PROTEIN: hypothetical protein HZS_406 [Henneguya salminicola]